MNAAFSGNLIALRRERGISQREAAGALGISQALLSHYEKGIRECGLDFVVKAADYYRVSCDYLLGRTEDRFGTTLSSSPEPDTESAETLSKKQIVHSLHILFDQLDRCRNSAVSGQAASVLMLAVYLVLRPLLSANPKTAASLFPLPEASARANGMAELMRRYERLKMLCEGSAVGGQEALSPAQIPELTPESVAKAYPMFAAGLFNLIKNAEAALA